MNYVVLVLDIVILCTLIVGVILIHNSDKNKEIERSVNKPLNISYINDQYNAVDVSKGNHVNDPLNNIISHTKDHKNMIKSMDLLTCLINESKENQAMESNDLLEIKKQVQEMTNALLKIKHRGTFNEYPLNDLMSVYCGEHTMIWETQYHLKNGTIGDVALHLPQEKDKVLIIDSKFPMENSIKLMHDEESENINSYLSLFKKHINDLSKKYINSETVEQVIMYIPSEAIYSYICFKCPDLLEESDQKKVLMASPTTLIGIIFTLVNSTKEFKRTQNLKKIEKAIVELKGESLRLLTRKEKTDNHIYDGHIDENLELKA